MVGLRGDFTEDHDHTSLGTCIARDFGSYSTKSSRTVSRYDHIACRDVACYRLGGKHQIFHFSSDSKTEKQKLYQ